MGVDDIKGDEVTKINGMFESKYLHDSKAMQDKLNEVSPSFCLAKWFNVSIHIPTGQTHSCYHPLPHKVPLNELAKNASALHNTEFKKEQRKQMLEGKRPVECKFCWDIEDSSNQISDRAYRSQDVVQPGIFEEAKALGYEGDAIPKYLEVNFNQACNFKCIYCTPKLSTAWAKDVKDNGPYYLKDHVYNDTRWMYDEGLVPNNSPSNPYLKAFWEWFPVVYPELKVFRMTGGEPLMDKNTFKIFDYIKANPKPDLQLKITSNCNPPGNQWNTFMNDLKELTPNLDHFMLFCSLDSWGESAEYIRDGLDFDVMYENVRRYLKEGDRHSLTFIVTFNALSLPNWKLYLENILELRKEFNTNRQLIWFDTPMLTYPNWLSCQNLSNEKLDVLLDSIDYMKQNAETWRTRFRGFKDTEVSRIQRLYDWAKLGVNEIDRERNIENAKEFFKQYDARTGKSFNDLFGDVDEFFG